MGADRWRRIEELFAAAQEVAADEQAAFLARAAGGDEDLRREVEELLRAAERAGDFLEEPAGTGDAGLPPRDDAPPAERIGPYRLLRHLGEGGMSRVYLAVRDDDEYQKLVALKVIRQGMDSADILRRFRTERQILAVLEHANIARLLDGGHTEAGLPYFVMDYVEGTPVDAYCDRRRLTLRQRLELFRAICAAVQYAHQNLIVHRDLKPSNILVTADGDVKLLDFGIAKLLKPEQFPLPVELTATRFRPMTPFYASPEQIRGKPVTTASDVYSLGVLLYVLMTGRLPYRVEGGEAREIERAVLEQEPVPPAAALDRGRASDGDDGDNGDGPAALAAARRTPPAQLRRQLSGDLENVVLTALRKEPARRYPSVEQLAEDVRRYLANLPVLAHKDSLRYRAGKFLARNRVAVAAAAAFVVLLVSFAAAMALQAARIAEEKDRVERQRDQLEKVVAFMQDIFRESDPLEAGDDAIVARRFLDRGAERVVQELGHSPLVQALLMESIATVYLNLGLYDSAQPLLEQALAVRLETQGADHLDVARSRSSLGEVLRSRGDYAGAEARFLEALKLRRELLGGEHPEVADSLHRLGRLKQDQGSLGEAEELYRQALSIRRRNAGEGSAEVAENLTDLAVVLAFSGQLPEAGTHFREALALRRRDLGDHHPLVAQSLNDLGVFMGMQGDLDAAEPLLRDALELRRELLGGHHPDVAENIYNIGRLLKEKQDYAAAEPLYTEAIEILRDVHGGDHLLVGERTKDLGFLLKEKGDFPGAEAALRQALAIFEKIGDQHFQVGICRKGIGWLYLEMGRSEGAVEELGRALAILEESLPADHWHLAETRSLLGASLTRRGRFAEAEPLLIAGFELLAAQRGAGHKRTRGALERAVDLYDAWGRDEKAAEYRSLRAPESG